MMNPLIFLMIVHLAIVQILTFDSTAEDNDFRLSFFSNPDEEIYGPHERGENVAYGYRDDDTLTFGPLKLGYLAIHTYPCNAIPILLGFFASSLDSNPTSGQQPEDNFILGMEKTKETLIPLFQTEKVHPLLFGALLNDKTQKFISQHRKELKQYLDTKKALIDRILASTTCDCGISRCTFKYESPQRYTWPYTDRLISSLRKTMNTEPTYWSLVKDQPCEAFFLTLCEVEQMKAAQKISHS
ncbi:hypothetical protein HMI54_013178 [Coelomomyces lativittatus]|nr:hypothetical protein HMI55_005516 [Coelomomyces lativittatus]KAJ1497925.1 hypothetical protein HMI54_013178 [Coelomomyces lativittatus]KAJ1498250.1 hypothetical protein HMI56_005097 [Coelomomyces lativittatus]